MLFRTSYKIRMILPTETFLERFVQYEFLSWLLTTGAYKSMHSSNTRSDSKISRKLHSSRRTPFSPIGSIKSTCACFWTLLNSTPISSFSFSAGRWVNLLIKLPSYHMQFWNINILLCPVSKAFPHHELRAHCAYSACALALSRSSLANYISSFSQSSLTAAMQIGSLFGLALNA